MLTVNEVKKDFASENCYSYDETEELGEEIMKYIKELDFMELNGDRENQCWEVGYIEGYGKSLRKLKSKIKDLLNN